MNICAAFSGCELQTDVMKLLVAFIQQYVATAAKVIS
jgi:hypothetical protein